MNGFRNPNLHQALERFVNEARKINGITDAETFQTQLAALPDYNKCVKEIEQDSVISQHFNKDIQFGTGGFYVNDAAQLLQYLISVIGLEQPIEGSQSAVSENLYKDIEEFFYNSNMRHMAFAPVQGLGVFKEKESLRTATSQSYDDESAPLIFSDDLQLAPLDQSESATAHQMETIRRHHLRMSDNIYAVKVKFKVRKTLRNPNSDFQIAMESQADFEQKMRRAIEKIEEVLTALRLYKPGRISIGGILCKPQNKMFGNVSGVPYALGNPFFDPRPYTLDLAKEGAGLVHLHSIFVRTKAGNYKNLIVAARWLSRSSEADNLEDRVIALMIAAEALSQTGRNGGKGEQIGNFIANLFPSEKAAIEEHLRGLYRLRNCIVHTGTMTKWIQNNLPDPNEIFGFIGRGADIVRDALVIKLEKTR